MNHVTALTCTDDTDAETSIEVPSTRKSPRPPVLDLSLAYCADAFTFEEKKKTSSRPEEEYAFGHIWAFYSRRGKRRANREDTFCAHPSYAHLSDNEPVSLFGVFDGHGGDHAARYVSKRLPTLFSSFLKKTGNVREALTKAFLFVDKELIEKSSPDKKAEKAHTTECFKRANSGGFLGSVTLQRALSNHKVKGIAVEGHSPQVFRRANSKAEDRVSSKVASTHAACGTTATAAILFNNKLIIAHVGDSRAVLSLQDGCAIRLFEDHRPAREDEKARVEEAGGVFFNEEDPKNMRVDGVLAITRAIGRRDLRACVIPDPEVSIRVLNGEETFLVVASDGLWDHVKDEECVSLVRKVFNGKSKSGSGAEGKASKELVKLALERGSADDISVLVVNLEGYRKSSHSYGGERVKLFPDKAGHDGALQKDSSGGKDGCEGGLEVPTGVSVEESGDSCQLPLETPRNVPNRSPW